MTLKTLANRVATLQGKREALESQLQTARSHLEGDRALVADREAARAILQSVAKATQEELEYHIASLVTLSMGVVLPEPYEAKLLFEPKRGRSEASILFSRDGQEVSPMDSVGGGALDVASFGLRIAMWVLAAPQTRPVVIMDEPFRNLSEDRQSKAATLLNQLSEKLGIQFIIVTHERRIIEEAVDRVFEVSISGGESKVEKG